VYAGTDSRRQEKGNACLQYLKSFFHFLSSDTTTRLAAVHSMNHASQVKDDKWSILASMPC